MPRERLAFKHEKKNKNNITTVEHDKNFSSETPLGGAPSRQ